MRKIRRWGAWLLLIIPLALNAQQRTEKLLNVPLPEHWQEEDAMFQQQLPVDDHWWTVFQDATLDSLIHVAVRQNPSVLTALNRIDMAKSESEDSQRRLLSGFVIGCQVEPPTD